MTFNSRAWRAGFRGDRDRLYILSIVTTIAPKPRWSSGDAEEPSLVLILLSEMALLVLEGSLFSGRGTMSYGSLVPDRKRFTGSKGKVVYTGKELAWHLFSVKVEYSSFRSLRTF